MAIAVRPRAEKFRAQPQVERERLRGLPVILREDGGIALLVSVVVNAAAAETEGRSATYKVAEVRRPGVDEEQLSVENLREQLVEAHPHILAAKGERVRAVHPAQVVHKVVVVLLLRLIGLRRRSKLKAGSRERELVDAGREVAGGPVDSNIVYRDRIDIRRRVVDMNKSEAEIIDQSRREHVGF